jgi:hypothetical protein
MCDEICMQYEFVVPICGCGDPSIPQVENSTVLCKNATTLACVKNVTDNYEAYNIGTHCDTFCPLECNSNSYSKSISIAYYPTAYYSRILSSQVNLRTKFSSGQVKSFSPPSKTFSGRRRRDVADSRQLVSLGPPPPSTLGTTTRILTTTSTTTTTAANVGSTVTTSGSATTGAGTLTATVVSTSATTTSTSGVGATTTTTKPGPTTTPSTPSSSEIQQSVLALSIYYDDLRYVSIQENPVMTVDTLVGLLGKIQFFLTCFVLTHV